MIMRRHAKLVWLLVAMLSALRVSAGLADEFSWSDLRSKLLNSSEYSLNYEYTGPDGNYRCHYVLQAGGAKILTEVLAGSSRGSGARILYDGAKDKDNVTVQTSFLTLRRSTDSKDIKGSSLYQPLFQQLVEGLVEPNPKKVVDKANHKILVFGDKAKTQDYLEVDQQGNPIAAWRAEGGEVTTRITFAGLSWKDTAIVWP